MKHINKSKRAKEFFKAGHGITISPESCHNYLKLINSVTGEVLELEACSYLSVADGIPGIYVQKRNKKFTDVPG